jgi:hypothetical protein
MPEKRGRQNRGDPIKKGRFFELRMKNFEKKFAVFLTRRKFSRRLSKTSSTFENIVDFRKHSEFVEIYVVD